VDSAKTNPTMNEWQGLPRNYHGSFVVFHGSTVVFHSSFAVFPGPAKSCKKGSQPPRSALTGQLSRRTRRRHGLPSIQGSDERGAPGSLRLRLRQTRLPPVRLAARKPGLELARLAGEKRGEGADLTPRLARSPHPLVDREPRCTKTVRNHRSRFQLFPPAQPSSKFFHCHYRSMKMSSRHHEENDSTENSGNSRSARRVGR
jgi:hypothetical protein